MNTIITMRLSKRAIFCCCLVSSLAMRGQARKPNLQEIVAKALGGQAGALAVVDVQSGKLLAASHPEVAARRLVLPGSAIKPFTLLAVLQTGTITAESRLMCRRELHLSGRSLPCSHVRQSEPFDAVAALAYSCNSFFAQAAAGLDPLQFQQSLIRAGLAGRTGWVKDEATGNIELSRNQEELELQALGEANIRITPLELLAAYRNLALRRGDSNLISAPVYDGLEAATSYGTARMAQPAGMKVAGKTGTSSAEAEGRWTHAWFAGFAPADEPRIALVVFLERGHGSGDAAAVARNVFQAVSAL